MLSGYAHDKTKTDIHYLKLYLLTLKIMFLVSH